MMHLGEELVVEGVTYVLVSAEKIRLMTGDADTWICSLCQLHDYCDDNKRNMMPRCGPYERIFVKKLEV